MAITRTIEVRYTRLAPSDASAFTTAYQIRLDGELTTKTIEVAGFHINDAETGKKQYLELTLGNGLSWDDADKVLAVNIDNSQLSFIREDKEFHYEAFVVLNNKTHTVAEGTVTAVRVG